MYQGLMGGVDRASNRHNAPFQTPDCQQRALGHRNLAFYRQRERETETPNPLEFLDILQRNHAREFQHTGTCPLGAHAATASRAATAAATRRRTPPPQPGFSGSVWSAGNHLYLMGARHPQNQTAAGACDGAAGVRVT